MTDPQPPPKHPWIQMYEDWKASPDNETYIRKIEDRQSKCPHPDTFRSTTKTGVALIWCRACGKATEL